VTEVAVTVTVLPGGIAEGAVYPVSKLLAVVVGLKEPHSEPPQLTVHFTWGLAEVSFVTVAPKDTVAFTCTDAGIDAAKETAIERGGVMVTVAEIDLVESAAAVAVIVTVDPAGMAAGAV
jgi:hypothetical protein